MKYINRKADEGRSMLQILVWSQKRLEQKIWTINIFDLDILDKKITQLYIRNSSSEKNLI